MRHPRVVFFLSMGAMVFILALSGIAQRGGARNPDAEWPMFDPRSFRNAVFAADSNQYIQRLQADAGMVLQVAAARRQAAHRPES